MDNPKPSIRFAGFTGDWEQRKLEDVSKRVIVGLATSVTPYYRAEGVPILRNLNIKENYLDDSDILFLDRSYAESQISKQIRAGDVLTIHTGYIGISCVVPEKYDKCLTFTTLITTTDNSVLKGEFLTQYLNSDIGMSAVQSVTTQGGRQNLNTNDFVKVKIRVPSLLEQSNICAMLRNLDRLITLQQRKVEKLQCMKKAMLEKMFPQAGALVPEIRFAGFTGDWERCKVSEVAEIYAGGTPSTGIDRYWYPKEIPWLSSGEVHKKYITYTDNKISVEGMNNSSARMIPKNSVLIALAGQGKTRGTVAINRIPLTTNQSIAAMTFSEEIVPEFVFSNLENRYEEIRRMSSGDGSRGGLNKQLVGNIEIPYTSKEEQQKIGAFFEALDNAVTLHQRKVEKLQRMKKAMLEKMFV